ncbi:ecdysone-induced protein 75B, isoforms C/D-like [Sabethes cyaneus]|uniref:ecdysone-induced protein 75B, isoforms C/D-like n=1 Tax=Sabethes cyaneus TaxID=53552 RepID=UPI00237E1631|nr:ecdysone-induced protein 75B, isoforms C/D-like [Sabethes cyaneus]
MGSSRKPKRATGEIPLLIIRPIDKKKKKNYFKEPMVKLLSGGVASYGNYPEIHTNDGEVFSLEHMLPILGLEGMVFNGIPKIPHYSNHFTTSQLKPSESHYFAQKIREQLLPAPLTIKTSDTPITTLSHPSAAPPNYVPAINTEEQLLKLGQQSVTKLEAPGSAPSSTSSSSPSPSSPPSADSPTFSPLVQEKPAFVKPELLPTKFHFNKLQPDTMMIKAIPINPSPNYGPVTFFGMHNDMLKHYKPSFSFAPQPQSHKWLDLPKKPQMVSPLSISTNFFSAKPSSDNNDYQQQQQQPKTIYHLQQPSQHYQSIQTPQTHINYYFPKEIEALPQPQPLIQSHPPIIQHPSVPVNTVQNGEHVDFVVAKQPVQEVTTEKSYKPYNAHLKHKFPKPNYGDQSSNHPTFYIHKEFEFSGKPNSNGQPNKVTEYHTNSHNRSVVETQHLPEPVPYSAPQYLPLPQAQPLQQPAPAQTLHQSHSVASPQPFTHYNSIAPSQNHWKLGRRNHEQVKPVVEVVGNSEADSSHASSMLVQKAVKPSDTKSTTEVRIEVKHVPYVRTAADGRQETKKAVDGSSSSSTSNSSGNSSSSSSNGNSYSNSNGSSSSSSISSGGNGSTITNNIVTSSVRPTTRSARQGW